jgi:CRP/FNR family transcriptional regulator, transcriptional activator FtrB
MSRRRPDRPFPHAFGEHKTQQRPFNHGRVVTSIISHASGRAENLPEARAALIDKHHDRRDGGHGSATVATMRKADIELVRKLPLFADIEKPHLEVLVAGAFLQAFPARLELIQEGDLPDFLHIVVDGSVEVYGRLDERETALAVLTPPSTFVLAAVVRDEVYLTSARTLEATKILMIPAGAIRLVFDEDAAFARAVVGELANRYRELVRGLKGNKLRTSLERLANYVLAHAAQRGKTTFVLSLEKRTLASLLGMTPEHLSRALAQLAEHGVAVSGQTVTITDRPRLQRLANPHPLIDL